MSFSGELEQMKRHSDLLDQRKSDECGCPEEEWAIGVFNVIIHIEPDCRGDIFIDCGEWADDRRVDCVGIEDLRRQASEWVYSIPPSPIF